MDCSILSGHRRVAPFGMNGGEDGKTGKNLVRRKDGRIETLDHCAQTVLEPGEAFILETPTPGGFGAKTGS